MDVIERLEKLKFPTLYENERYRLIFIENMFIKKMIITWLNAVKECENDNNIKKILKISKNTYNTLLNLILDKDAHAILAIDKINAIIFGHFHFEVKEFIYIAGLFIDKKYQKRGLSRLLYDKSINIFFQEDFVKKFYVFALYPLNECAVKFWMDVHDYKWVSEIKVYLYKIVMYELVKENEVKIVMDFIKKEEFKLFKNGELGSYK